MQLPMPRTILSSMVMGLLVAACSTLSDEPSPERNDPATTTTGDVHADPAPDGGRAGGGASTADGSPSAGPSGGGSAFTVVANHIKKADGTTFHGRGANLLDTRFCGACGSAPSSGIDAEPGRIAEVNRRMDDLVDNWHASFIRLDLETLQGAPRSGTIAPDSVVSSATYLSTVKAIVDHAATKPGLLLLVSIWDSSSLDSRGWPTSATNQELALLATTFKDHPGVAFGVSNEPENNENGAQDAEAWTRMNQAVQAVRDAEQAANAKVKHLVAVQGLGSWSRLLGYYVTHPITAGGGANVVYEIHVYDPASAFATMFETYSASLPIIIGEFGPTSGFMTTADCASLMVSAEAHEIPYLAWQYGMSCAPDLVVDTRSKAACGIGSALTPTSWGNQLKARLATPW